MGKRGTRNLLVRVAGILAVGGLLAVGAIAWQNGRKAELGRRLLREFKSDLSQAGLEAGAGEYASGLADAFHAQAYEASFGPDAPALGGTTDVNAYQRALLGLMTTRARSDGAHDIASALEKFTASNATPELSGEQ